MSIEEISRKILNFEILLNEMRLELLHTRLETKTDQMDLITAAILRREAASLQIPEKYITNPKLLHPSIDIAAGIFYEITVNKSNIIGTNYTPPTKTTIQYQRSQKLDYYCFTTYFKNINGTMVKTSGNVTKYYRLSATSDRGEIDVEEIFCSD